MRLNMIAILILSSCTSGQRAPSDNFVDPSASNIREDCSHLDEIHRETLAFADVRSINPQFVILALDALNQGNTDCAECLLEAELDSQLMRADSFLESMPPQSALADVQPTIEFARSYRAANPWQKSECNGACAAVR